MKLFCTILRLLLFALSCDADVNVAFHSWNFHKFILPECLGNRKDCSATTRTFPSHLKNYFAQPDLRTRIRAIVTNDDNVEQDGVDADIYSQGIYGGELCSSALRSDLFIRTATAHFINLSNGCESMPYLAELGTIPLSEPARRCKAHNGTPLSPGIPFSYIRIQSSHCESGNFNGILGKTHPRSTQPRRRLCGSAMRTPRAHAAGPRPAPRRYR